MDRFINNTDRLFTGVRTANKPGLLILVTNIQLNIKLLIYLFMKNFDCIQYVSSGSEGYYGGSVTLADYCPYIQEFTWRHKDVVVRGSHCQFKENNPSRKY